MQSGSLNTSDLKSGNENSSNEISRESEAFVPNGAQSVLLAGQTVILLPQKAMYIPSSSTLVLADVHIGKAASFRSRNFFAPDGISDFDLLRLGQLIKELSIARLIILGDLVHAQDGMTDTEVEVFERFRAEHEKLAVTLILGNHDCKVQLPQSWKLDLVHGQMVEAPFLYSHEPIRSKDGYVLCGHVHPSVTLSGQGKQRERLPCFWLRSNSAILPAYGAFTGSYTIRPSRNDRVFVIAHDTVVPVT
ncbi:ligase-associated DNA damage response endonuclease PdeM [bacterium]|nr:ligase-associated DNA damage response endonuclease PdeM [bacterium]MBP9807826.1 ligase-associated DNA damage response endonuclease PdeM [bacterium]